MPRKKKAIADVLHRHTGIYYKYVFIFALKVKKY